MTLVLVLERQYDVNNNPIKRTIKNPRTGQNILTSVTKDYYMDLDDEEEKKLRETGRFGFEAIRSFDLPKILANKEEIKKGAERKRDILGT